MKRFPILVFLGAASICQAQEAPPTAPVEMPANVPVEGQEMVLKVKAKKHLIQNSASVSSVQVDQEQIAALPSSNEIKLPKLLSTTIPGAVPGAFGQVFFRGNHANIQYQIDGVQMPDSPTNTFGDAFSPRNIDHMDIITGGVPAEYGERLAAVVNIMTKAGPEHPGGDIQLNYGSYNTFSPHAIFGGSTSSGNFHYFLSANYNRTDRGLDTPQPSSEGNQGQGGEEAVHDQSSGNSEFGHFDWLIGNDDKFSALLFNAENNFQIPTYPVAFHVGDAFFQPGYLDNFGNGGGNGPTFNFVPSNTNDNQSEAEGYLQLVWKHTFSPRAFLQMAPYYKYSYINFQNDPVNDLFTSPSGGFPIAGASPSSFYENRHVNNGGLKGDLTIRPTDSHLVKTGFQVQGSRSDGTISVQTDLATPAVSDGSSDVGYFESVYVQDDYTIFKPLILNAGLRFDATQFSFSGLTPTDWLLQPRIGLNLMVTDSTKLHMFYGRLFQPAPVENLRDTFINSGSGQLAPYDIKAEKDNYYEAGVAQQFLGNNVVALNTYYKDAQNMLDDAQLLNTSIAQPFNFATGYAYGVELSLRSEMTDWLSGYINYSYEIAKGEGISGGIFAFPAGQAPGGTYQFLDHVQVNTVNGGLTFTKWHFWSTVQGLYGDGLRTGPNNSAALPPHFTADLTLGYEFHGESWYSRWKVSGDVLNVFDNAYPISIANGFNGSHYAPGREFFARVTKEL